MDVSTFVGPVPITDGAGLDRLRQGRQGEQIVATGHGDYYEQASRSEVFSAFTAQTGTTIVSGNVAPPAAAAATVLSILNPIDSGVNLEILRGWVMHISGTPGAGAFFWCGTAAGASITAATNATARSTVAGGAKASVASVWTQTALTGGTVHTNLRPFPTAQFAGAIAATTPGQVAIDEVRGSIVVAPGGVLTIAPAATGTTHIVVAGIEWAEVKRPS